jgi:hypothetical protein
VTTRRDLDHSIDKVYAAMKAHADACEADQPPTVVVPLAVEISDAVLEYERDLGEVYHWSCPIRYLDPPLDCPDLFDEDYVPAGRISPPVRHPDAGPIRTAHVTITITHQVAIPDAEEFPREIQLRYGEDDELDLLTSVRKVVEADTWRPSAREWMRTLSTEIDVQPRVSIVRPTD